MQKYTLTARSLHWLMALVIPGLFGLGVWMRELDYYSPYYDPAPHWHKSIGIIVLVLFVIRLVWRFLNPPPAPLSNHKTWEKNLAHAMHWFFYIALSVIFMSGYLIATADDRSVSVFGLFELPPLFTPFAEQEDIAGEIHEWAAWSVIIAALLHAAGAIKHHMFDKDSTLKRML